jgi:hypothetical protein
MLLLRAELPTGVRQLSVADFIRKLKFLKEEDEARDKPDHELWMIGVNAGEALR